MKRQKMIPLFLAALLSMTAVSIPARENSEIPGIETRPIQEETDASVSYPEEPEAKEPETEKPGAEEPLPDMEEEPGTENEEPGAEPPPEEEQNPDTEAPDSEKEPDSEAEPNTGEKDGMEEIPGEGMVPDTDEEEWLIFDESNAGNLTAGDEETKEVVEEIEAGEVLALTLAEDIPTTRAASGSYRLINNGYIHCDEVWTKENLANQSRMSTCQYEIEYTDADGKLTRAPAYCLEANQLGIAGPGQTTAPKDEAVKILTNSNMKKLLYFGYGGPGDIGAGYDPTCSHITWNARNRYVFTHFALSKVYCGETGYATASEMEHVGLNRYISHITSLTLPSHTGTKLKTSNVAGSPVTGQSIQADLKVCKPGGRLYPYAWEEFQNGCRVTNEIVVSDSNEKNGISFSRKASDTWQLVYWKNQEDYEQRGSANPRTGPKTGAVSISAGGRFRMLFPLEQKKSVTLTFPLLLKPITYLWLDADEQSSSAYQDYGFVTHEGTYGYTKLTLNPLPMGSLLLTKKCAQKGTAVAGASYGLYADEELYSGRTVFYHKDQLVETGVTDQSGSFRFSGLIPGKYYIKETKAAPGYLLDTAKYPVTVKANHTSQAAEATLSVKDEPIASAACTITVTKKIRESDITWAHGNPTFFFTVEGNDAMGRPQKFEDFVSFSRGNYTTDGQGYAVLSTTFSKVPQGTYEVYEQPVLRYFLKSAAANTSNVTIVTNRQPAYGNLPRETAYARAVLDSSRTTAKITFLNEKSRYDDYSHNAVVENKIPIRW